MALILQLAAFCISLAGYHVSGEFLYRDAMPADTAADWSYHGTNGPDYWCKLNPPYPECCKTKKRQSPVNINIEATKYPAVHLTYENYDVQPDSMTLFNNGHTVVLTSQSGRMPSISFNYLGSKRAHTLDDVHFHWGKISSRGSEHSLDKSRSPMEMHFVHRRHLYKSLFMASRYNESIAVVGVFFEISKENNTRFNTIINSLKLVKYSTSSKSITPFKYTDLLPSNNEYFFTYKGSLTTPPCTENVRWFVLNTKVQISEAQLNEFRQLQEKPLSQNPNNAFPMVDNFRPQQDLNKRHIYRSKLH